MEDISEINGGKRLPVSIHVEDYLLDHVFNGQSVLPAVEIMRLLAEFGRKFMNGNDIRFITDADFTKFLNIGPSARYIEAYVEIERLCCGIVSTKLITKHTSGKSGITRYNEHASISFTSGDTPAPPHIDITLGLEGICVKLDKDRIYRELIPFKTAYQNIDELFVSEQGALAKVSGGTGVAPAEPLGSPFPLDASFHAACVWGQRYAGIIGFPVHIDRRSIIKKTAPGKTYTSRITPVKIEAGLLIFDLWIYDDEGELCEEARGLHMKDVSGDALKPPGWIQDKQDRILDPIRSRCRDLSIIELATVSGPCAKILSPQERELYNNMREKRGRSFLAARLALKKLSRRISSNDDITPPHAITTMKPGGRPCCPLTSGDEAFYCTASHDARFAVAAVSERRIGIDVEEISGRVLKSRRLYMHERELSLVKSHALGEMEASARVWTAKEAVAKATGMHLAEAWRRAEVKEIGRVKSTVMIDEKAYEVNQAIIDNHLFTLITV
jgi:phosphopantetheinyl transferase